MFLLGAMATMAAGAVSTRAADPFPPHFDVLSSDIEHIGAWTPGLAPDSIEAELADIIPRKGYVYLPGVSTGTDYVYDRLEDLYDKTGLRIGAAYTMLFQGLSGGPWPRYGGAGDFDFMTSWTLIGKNTENTGRLLFDFEERFAIGNRTPNSLGAGVATLQPTANTFNDRGLVIRNFFWSQGLFDGQLRLILGRADLGDYFGSTFMQSANNSFVNRMFASNPTIAGPGHGPAVGMSYQPTDCPFFISAGAANAYNTTTTSGFDTLDEWTFFTSGEVGWTPKFAFGEGRYTVSGWHAGERTKTGLPEDWGLSAIADQMVSENVDVFARYGYSEAGTLGLRHYAQCGMGIRGLIACQTNDVTGIGFSYAWPHNSSFRQEKVVEVFYRAQFSRFIELSVGTQAIFDPGNSPGNDVVGAYWGRVRFTF